MGTRVAICIPTAGLIQCLCYHSVVSTVNQLKGATLNDLGPLEFLPLLAQGVVLQQNRDGLIDTTLEYDCDYMLFVDDDMQFSYKAVAYLLSRRLPIVFANYPMKKFPLKWTAKQVDKVSDLVTTEESTGIEECAFGGFGLSLFHTSILKDIKKPRFYLGYDQETGQYSTEDYLFYEKINVPKFVDHDASKLVKHVGSYKYAYDSILPTPQSQLSLD